jgi:glycosyltransferase involved in cell wall biosynthesis
VKIAQVCPRFYPHIGGVETHVYEIASRIAKKFDVEVLTTDPGGKLPKVEEIDGVTVRRFRSFAPSDAYYFSLELYRYLKKHNNKYDLVHAHNYHAFPALFAALTKRENKFVFTPHYHAAGHSFFRNMLHKPYKSIGKRIYETADAIICVSNYEKRLVQKNFDVASDKIHVIPNGVNLEEFKDVDKMKDQKDRSLKRVLYVGRIEKYKGLDYVVKSLNHLPDEFILEIVGKGSYKPKIVEIAKKLGVISRVRFYQDLSREELVERYAKADVFVLLSKHEAFGIAVAEALAAKTPCVVAKTSALKEWVDEKNVFGVDYPIDVLELAELIKKVSEVDAVDVKLPDWNEVAERLTEIYTALL